VKFRHNFAAAHLVALVPERFPHDRVEGVPAFSLVAITGPVRRPSARIRPRPRKSALAFFDVQFLACKTPAHSVAKNGISTATIRISGVRYEGAQKQPRATERLSLRAAKCGIGGN